MEQKLCNDSPIVLGRQGEYGINTIKFDCSDWVKEYGEGTILLLHKRSRDEYPYPVPVRREGNVILWDVTSVETAYIGFGKAEYHFVANGKLAKSIIIQTKVLPALDSNQVIPIPDPYETWIDEIVKELHIVNTKLNGVEESLLEEINRAQSIENKLNWLITAESITRNSKDIELENGINSLNNILLSEITRAEEKERELSDSINILDNSKADKLNTYTKTEVDELIEGATPADYDTVKAQVIINKDNIELLQSSLEEVEDLIPSQASADNQLADKNFVNSSIATNTADFVGTFNSLGELLAYPTTDLTNNDYAFVQTLNVETQELKYDRYKWNTEEWLYEYTLNNSSFTAAQLAAINSGITSSDVEDISSLKENKADKSDVYTKAYVDDLVAKFTTIVNDLKTKLDSLTPPEGYAYLMVKETK